MTFVRIFLVIALATAAAHGRNYYRRIFGACKPYVDVAEPCKPTVGMDNQCRSGLLDLTNTELAGCERNDFFWSYPANNLTIVIATPFTEQQQPYEIRMRTGDMDGYILNIYRVIGNTEHKVRPNDNILVQESDSNYQVILKFQGPPDFTRYGLSFEYEAVPI